MSRQREIAVRMAMGAGRGRIARQWLTESVVIGVAATAAGVLVALWARDALDALRPAHTGLGLSNLSLDLPVDWRLLAFATTITAAVTTLFGGLPAWRAARTDIAVPLKEDGFSTAGSRRRRWSQGALVVAQVAVSLALLVSAGLLARSMASARAFDVGFDTSNLTIATANTSGLGADRSRIASYYQQTLQRVRQLPGVRSATLAAVVPLGGDQESRGIAIDGYTPSDGRGFISTPVNIVVPGYFEGMGIPVVRGRGFVAHDGEEGALAVAVVNETMARRYWRDGNPIGQRIRLGKDAAVEIAGVVRDTTYYAVGEPPMPYMYLPFGPFGADQMSFHVRAAAADASLARALRRELRAFDARVQVPDALPYDQLRQLPLYPGRVMATVSTAFGALALVLTIVGIYGVVMYAVSLRTREFAVRMALGARPADILSGVLGEGLRMVVVGIAIGMLMAAALTRLFRGFLFGVSALDLYTFGGWSIVLLGVALVASYLPARRAIHIDPAATLTGRQ